MSAHTKPPPKHTHPLRKCPVQLQLQLLLQLLHHQVRLFHRSLLSISLLSFFLCLFHMSLLYMSVTYQRGMRKRHIKEIHNVCFLCVSFTCLCYRSFPVGRGLFRHCSCCTSTYVSYIRLCMLDMSFHLLVSVENTYRSLLTM